MNVCLFGQMCAGKTTLANALESEFGFVRMSLASRLKNIVGEVYGTYRKDDTVLVTTASGDVEPISVRAALQRLGDGVKSLDADFWIKWFLADAASYSASGIPVVCDDGRLLREADTLRTEGWLLVRVETPEEVRLERYRRLYGRYPTEAEMAHRTEMEVASVPADLVIDGTLPIERQAELIVIALAEAAANGEVP